MKHAMEPVMRRGSSLPSATFRCVHALLLMVIGSWPSQVSAFCVYKGRFDLLEKMNQLSPWLHAGKAIPMKEFDKAFQILGVGTEVPEPPFTAAAGPARYRRIEFVQPNIGIRSLARVEVEARVAATGLVVTKADLYFNRCITAPRYLRMKAVFPIHPSRDASSIRYIGHYGAASVWTDLPKAGEVSTSEIGDACLKKLSFRLEN